MHIIEQFDFRNAEIILKNKYPEIFSELKEILDNPTNELKLKIEGKKQRNISKQIQKFFEEKNWKTEQPTFVVPDLIYDAVKENVPVEIEISYQRQVYADFFKFLMDYSNGKIEVAVLVVTNDPKKFGHNWHASLKSTKKKLLDIKNNFLVPILVIGINP
jgi:hypothetical protein